MALFIHYKFRQFKKRTSNLVCDLNCLHLDAQATRQCGHCNCVIYHVTSRAQSSGLQIRVLHGLIRTYFSFFPLVKVEYELFEPLGV